jgi:dTDP-4-dehydrorhamnose reductase
MSTSGDERDKQRLLIIGARGFIGTYAVQAAHASERYVVIRGERSSTGEPNAVHMDISDEASVNRAFQEIRPNAVLLLAAMADIDACEAQPQTAFAINAQGAECVGNACARTGARLLFVSSGAVFDGTKHDYREEDETTPLSVYGKTKAWAEVAVRGLVPTATIVRIGLVLGFARRRGTNAMLDQLIEKWRSGQPVSFPTYEKRNPIDAASLSGVLIDAIGDLRMSGIYHVGAADSVSRYELGLRLARRLDVPLDLVRPQETPIPGRAPRGRDHFLLTYKIRKARNLEFGSSDLVIQRCFS